MKNKTIFLIIFSVISNISLASSQLEPKQIKWSFEGIFGHFDKTSIQRGFKVFKEVCQSCHSLGYLSYRDLQKIGFSIDEIKAIAAEYQVDSQPNEEGVIVKRPANIHDMFVPSYPNEQAARAANNGAWPPDLSLMVKARPDGANYLYSILTGYRDAPQSFNLNPGMYYNPYFPNKQIAMPPPLSPGLTSYHDNDSPSVEQMSKDVVNFLQWAAEPEMEQRKLMGIKVVLYLIIFTVIFYLAKKRIWSRIK